MTVFTATRAGATRAAVGVGNAQDLKVAWGTIEITTNPLLGDSYIMCKLPKGALIVGGRITGDPLDSSGSGSALLGFNCGVDKAVTAADGTAFAATSTSNCLGASMAFGPDAVAVAGYKATNTRNFPFGSVLVTSGPLLTSDDCNVYLIASASALAFSTGTLNVFVEYYQQTTS